MLFHLVTNLDFLKIGRGHDITNIVTIVSKLTGVVAPNSVILNDTTAWMDLLTPGGGWFGFVIRVEVSDTKG